MSVISSVRDCPNCSRSIDSDPRFSDWCQSCDWNLGPDKQLSGRAASRRARDLARVEQLYGRLVEQPAGSRWSVARCAALGLATVVHLATLAVAGGSLWLLVEGYPLLKVVGALGLGLTYLLRPRLGRWRAESGVVDRERAPQLYALVDRIADELGTRRPDRIKVSTDFQASYVHLGVRRRVQLTLGLPLWTVLTPEERVALLGHELGHGVNGDERRGFWLSLAADTLEAWQRLLVPTSGDLYMLRVNQRGRARTVRGARTQKTALDEFANWLLQVVALPVRGAHRLLHRLTRAGSQRAEYLADELAAGIGSSQAAASMLGKLYLRESVMARLRQQRAGGPSGGGARGAEAEEGLWTGLRDYLDSIPPSELERRSRLSARTMTSIDASHPPTHLRVRLRAERPEQPAAVVLDAAEWAVIDTELGDLRRAAARALLGH
ncbi:M48 family metallopeptidase [Kitasatospora mediocidica]|uniref:M48 family metallopeptidase n=1 Tax=Kitasatospora mediocidica TaxID=58352 RepID=UPI00068B2A92|nr:M48 family metallopeptidase [Kitasatospora mediocidica]